MVCSKEKIVFSVSRLYNAINPEKIIYMHKFPLNSYIILTQGIV